MLTVRELLAGVDLVPVAGGAGLDARVATSAGRAIASNSGSLRGREIVNRPSSYSEVLQ
jgi:hypothetical protein